MTPPATIEAVKSAIIAAGYNPATALDIATVAITAHLSALQAQGMVIVPREPTSQAIDNARLVGPIMLVERDVGAPYARTLLAEEALAIYRAMITAANPTP